MSEALNVLERQIANLAVEIAIDNRRLEKATQGSDAARAAADRKAKLELMQADLHAAVQLLKAGGRDE